MGMEDECHVNNLPPGFQFCPTDEELVLHFLYPKSLSLPNSNPNFIPQLHHLHMLHPWELHGKALLSGKQYFFFSQMMENRVLENGYWKELDTEEPIFSSGSGKKVIGVKKMFEFYKGQPIFGFKTNWLMQEYHLCDWGSLLSPSDYYNTKGNTKLDCSELVLCKVEEHKGKAQRFSCTSDEDGSELSCLDEMFLSLDHDDLDDDIYNLPSYCCEYN